MPLIVVPRHTAEDLAAWREEELRDLAWSTSDHMRGLVREALDELERFASAGLCYASTSWGKDSTVLAHLVWTLAEERGLDLPLVWVRVEPIKNTHCPLVRDAFLGRWVGLDYHEHEVWCRQDEDGEWHATGTLEEGFSRACRELRTDRYVLGLRAEESGGRKRRIADGLSRGRSCAPIGHWTERDVFAYLAGNDLPVHPAYAMTWGGRLDRGRIRVASLGGDRGTGFGRGEWERSYYSAP